MSFSTSLKNFKYQKNIPTISRMSTFKFTLILLISSVFSTPLRCRNKSKSENISDAKSIDSFPSERADYLVEDILFLNPLSALEENQEEDDTDLDYMSDEDIMFNDLNRHKLVLTDEEIQQDLKNQQNLNKNQQKSKITGNSDEKYYKDC